MAHESFEDGEVARILNEHFISIKVDREERPDVDNIYMIACQAMTGRGGWPLSIFMTPDKVPFFAGSYFPKRSLADMMGFMDILLKIAELWQEDREKINESAKGIFDFLAQEHPKEQKSFEIDSGLFDSAYEILLNNYDSTWGGFGSAPKFPTPHQLTFLFRYYKRTKERESLSMAISTLDRMRNGGIFDQIGFGFHRYCVDKKWLIPHFEKMLYDQALLALAYLEAFQVTGENRFKKTVEEIFAYVLRDLRSNEEAFFTAEDADSEGKEGLFYLWEYDEIIRHLGEKEGALFCRFFGIDPVGNFEVGLNVVHLPLSIEEFAEEEGMSAEGLSDFLEESRKKLLGIRELRERPMKDDKILTAQNGLMIAALAKGYQILGDESYLKVGMRAANFILKKLVDKRGRLIRRYRDGEAAHPAFLEDYAFFVWGLLELFEATFDYAFLKKAINLSDLMIELFFDRDNGGFFFAEEKTDDLPFRKKDFFDGAAPSGNAVAAQNLIRLFHLTGDGRYEEVVKKVFSYILVELKKQPVSYTALLQAIDFYIGQIREIVIVGAKQSKTATKMLAALRGVFDPHKTVIFFHDKVTDEQKNYLAPHLRELEMKGETRAYLCEDFLCKAPLFSAESLIEALKI